MEDKSTDIREIDELRERLEESEAVINAIRQGGVDAVVVYHPSEQVYTLKGADYSYRVLIEAMSEGALVISTSGMIAYCNARFAEMLMTTARDLTGSSLLNCMEPGELSAFEKLLQAGITGSAKGEITLRANGGSLLPTHFSISPLLMGDFRGACAVVTDLTEQKLIAEEFREHRKEFQTLLNAISDTLVLFSPEMEILWTNCGNAHPLNEPPSEGVGQYCQALLRDLSAPSEDSPVARCFNTGEKEVSVLTHNGAVLDIRAFPIKEGDRVSRVFLLASDITEKMALQAEAMQACHLATLGELAAGIAHEINNPIMGIINYGQILINECSAVSLEKDLGKRIVKEGERIGRIVQTLLSYARDDERERKKTTPVSAILEESLILTQAQMRKESIDLKIKLLDDLPEVDVNFQQIQQSFINIISNARYALNEKYPGRHKNKVLEITGEKVILSDRPYVRIVFHDHGVGISPLELPMLTKAFFSTKPSGKGTGLGLNITDRIITDHGGSLGFESLKGEFTKVIIDLPAKVKNECQDSSH